jgi:hypothetical protein
VLPADLIERVAKGDSEDPGLAPLYEDGEAVNFKLKRGDYSAWQPDGVKWLP